MRTKQGELFTALPSLREELKGDEFVIVESNSLRKFLEPALFLQVIDLSKTDFKVSSQVFFDLADAYVLVTGPSDSQANNAASQPGALLARELRKGKPCIAVTATGRFVCDELTEFVRYRLHLSS